MKEFTDYLSTLTDGSGAEPIWVAIPSGVLVGFAGSKTALAQKLAQLTGESFGDFTSLTGDPGAYLFFDGDDGFYLVGAFLVSGGMPIPLNVARIRTGDVSAFGPFSPKFLAKLSLSRK